MSINSFDRQMMQRCLHLARRGLGQTSPNPLVGAVIVKDGKIVGEGFHPRAGQHHAEVFALQAAGELAENATIYINLEPCSHYGRTPPCCDALIAAKLKKVVVGMIDPDPRVAGSGIAKLKAAGMEVVVGVEEEECRRLNEPFIHRITHQLPFGIFKYAMTLDGKIATSTGHSSWISSPTSRKQVHHLRSISDAVIIGGNTVRQDNPHLTSHGVGDRNPLRVVMSLSLDLPLECNLWQVEVAPTLIFTKPESNPRLQVELQARGVEIVTLNNLTPLTVMKNLYERGFLQVLWECGGNLAAQAIKEQVIQKIMVFIAPKIVGGTAAPSPIGNLGITNMSQALNLDRVKMSAIDSDWLLQGYLPPQTSVVN